MSSFYSVPGSPGPQGPEGPAGEGVPAGGTTGQTLVKTSNTDYDTEWADATGGGSATPAGSAGELQINDGLSPAGLGAVTGLKWDSANSELDVPGDINLDDGIAGPVTTLQTITPTQDNTISLPNATGTVALVAGSSGQPIYNNAGAYAGLSTATIGATGNITLSLNGASGVSPVALTGTWFAGTTPQVLIQPSNVGTTGSWSPSGTGIGVNAISTFTGNLLDLQVNGTSFLRFTSTGELIGRSTSGRIAFETTGTRFIDWVNFNNVFRVGGALYTVVRSDGSYGFSSTTAVTGTVDTALKRDQAGVVALTDGSTGTGYLKQTPVAVSALPAAATVGAGTRGFVSDSTVAASGNFGATVTGGGSNNVPVFSDGTNWLIG